MSSLRYFSGIQYGDFQNLEVLVDPTDNSLWITQLSIAQMLGWAADDVRKKLKAKSLEAFAGKALVHGKKLPGIDTIGRQQQVNAVPFDTFLTILYWQLQEGNGNARSLLLAGFADSFSSLVLDQCGIQVSTEERQQSITFYRHWYHKFQDWVRDTHLEVYGKKPTPEYYRDLAIAVNTYLFDRAHFYCDRIRYAETEQLHVIENFQMAFLRTKGARQKSDPMSLVAKYIKALESI